MAYFLLTTTDNQHAVIVSGKCITCARLMAAENAGPEGPTVWRDGARSTIQVLRENDASGFVFKGATHNDD